MGNLHTAEELGLLWDVLLIENAPVACVISPAILLTMELDLSAGDNVEEIIQLPVGQDVLFLPKPAQRPSLIKFLVLPNSVIILACWHRLLEVHPLGNCSKLALMRLL
jgi:hypothetical protein